MEAWLPLLRAKLVPLVASRFAPAAGGNGLNNFAIPTIQPNCKPSGFCLTYCLAVEGIFPSRP